MSRPQGATRSGAQWLRLLLVSGLIAALGPVLGARAFSQAPELAIPPLVTPVVDTANVLDSQTEAQLDSLVRRLWQSGGSQLAVVILPSLNGEPIEQASIKITDKWQLGSKTKDNGVLLLISRDDRALRIEVGQGLEGDLTDARSRRIIDGVITPYFRAGDYNSGVMAGVLAILQHTDPAFDPQVNAADYQQARGSGRQRGGLNFLLVLGLFLFITFARLFGGRSVGRSGWGGGGWGGGGWGGGGGGGGWGGGGGGFSGGGASGKW